MTKDETIRKTQLFIKNKFSTEPTGHDYWHMYRVWRLAKHIASKENNVDMFVVELAALLHDIADYKAHAGDEAVGPREARKWLTGLGVDEDSIARVADTIRQVDFKGAKVALDINTKEAQIVFEADKLDAMGAIGIARAFTYQGAKGKLLHDPDSPVELHESFEAYKNNKSTTINHFYEKLLLLKDLMRTTTGKEMAQHRHEYMEAFLQEFYDEWDGRR